MWDQSCTVNGELTPRVCIKYVYYSRMHTAQYAYFAYSRIPERSTTVGLLLLSTYMNYSLVLALCIHSTSYESSMHTTSK